MASDYLNVFLEFFILIFYSFQVRNIIDTTVIASLTLSLTGCLEGTLRIGNCANPPNFQLSTFNPPRGSVIPKVQ